MHPKTATYTGDKGTHKTTSLTCCTHTNHALVPVSNLLYTHIIFKFPLNKSINASQGISDNFMTFKRILATKIMEQSGLE